MATSEQMAADAMIAAKEYDEILKMPNSREKADALAAFPVKWAMRIGYGNMGALMYRLNGKSTAMQAIVDYRIRKDAKIAVYAARQDALAGLTAPAPKAKAKRVRKTPQPEEAVEAA